MSGPLSTLTVIELAGIGPGPFACMLLADLGATVIRIDRPPATAPAGGLEDLLRNDSIVDRGRHSVSLNLKDPRAVDTVLRLVEKADILIEGYRPGVVEKLGLGPAACHRCNPRLVYGRMTGWGQHGPLSQAAGHDINYIALTGALHAIGSGERPTPPLNLVGDYGGGGMLLALGVLAALHHAQSTGEGQVVDAAMTDGSALLMAAQYGFMAKGFWSDRRESNFLDGAAHFYGTYACADGQHIAVGAIEPPFYRQLLQLCGIEDPHFQQQWDQAQWPALRQKLEAVFRQRPRAEWCALLEGTDACVAPVLSLTEAVDHPHNQARQTLVKTEGVVQPAPAPRFDKTPPQLPPPAPAIGSATRAWLAQAGLLPTMIDAMVADGAAYAAADPRSRSF